MTTDIKTPEELLCKLKTFPAEIRYCGSEPVKDVLSRVFLTEPRLIFYISRYSTVTQGSCCTIRPDYRNTDYPFRLIHVTDLRSCEEYLHLAVLNYLHKVVLILPKNENFNWKYKCFKEQSLYSYPNLKELALDTKWFESIPYTVYEISFSYRIGSVMLRQMEWEAQKKAREIAALFSRMEMPDSVKCFLLHNYLACTVTYDNNDNGNPLERSYLQSDYGALIRHRCVCQGFAKAYQLLLKAVGVPSEIVPGTVLGPSGGSHAWNIVHLNHQTVHCHVDVTWDVGRPFSQKTYCFKSDSFLEGKRTWNRYFFSSCSDGSVFLTEAENFCRIHKYELLSCGFREEWLS